MTTSHDFTLHPHPTFPGREGPYLLVIMDGVGIGRHDAGDAVFHAHPEHLTRWIREAQEQGLYTQLKAHGPAVGLPSEKDMGNSEVGHNALGSGQIFAQGAKLVNLSLETGEFFHTDSWHQLIGTAAKNDRTVHFIGLLSDGNVHSHIDQLFKILDGVVATGVKHIRVHPLLDGRDVPPDSGLEYIAQLETKLQTLGTADGVDAKIASGGGRMYVTMDRYESNWNIVKRGWDAHVRGVVAQKDITAEYAGYFPDARTAIETARTVYPKKQDQYNPPFVIVNGDGTPVGRIEDEDVVINFNFRGDRAIEISKAFMFQNFDAFTREYYPNVHYAGLLEYDSDTHIPSTYLVPPPNIENISTNYFCKMGIKSYAIAETHKFGHVTYFWNGNFSGYINSDLEKYVEVKSEPNEMIEGHPEMMADDVTDELLYAIQSGDHKYLRVNYANGDMVGHTGNFDSAVRAVKKVDESLGKIVPAVLERNGVVIITADHGNCEELIDKKGRTVTSHSLNPVPFIILDSQFNGEYEIDTTAIEEPGIANVMATFMNLMGYEAPEFYEKSLVTFK